MPTTTSVLCAGIVVADHVCTPIHHLPAAGELVLAERILLTIGGCAANVAVDLAKMQVPVAVVGRVGDDLFGRVVSELLREAHVDISSLQVTQGMDTSQTLIINVQGQDRRFVHTFGANALMRAKDIPLERIRSARVLYVGGYLIMPKMIEEELLPVFQAAQQAGVLTVLDLAIPEPGDYLPRLRKLLPSVDLFLPNHDEAAAITGESDPLKQAELFHRLGAGTALITQGGAGAVLVSAKERLRAEAYPVPFVDGSGGGDAFAAGYISAWLQKLAPADCLRTASALGASCVQAVGTTVGVFTKQACDEFLRTHSLKVERV